MTGYAHPDFNQVAKVGAWIVMFSGRTGWSYIALHWEGWHATATAGE